MDVDVKIKANKKHYHACYQCQGKVSCWYLHRKDKSDLVGSLCDFCIDKVMQNLEESNV